jgi:uncharacterized damage-inducible protein DinB
MTTAVALIARLHQHRAWVNDNLLAAAAPLSDEQLRQAFPIGQGSVWRSLLHLYAAEFVWLEALCGNENGLAPGDLPGRLPGNQLADGAIASLVELSLRWARLAERWNTYLTGLSAEMLDEPVYRISSSLNAGQRFSARRSDVLLHVCTHAQYTTAQTVNMLRQLGVQELPHTMLMALARQESKK